MAETKDAKSLATVTSAFEKQLRKYENASPDNKQQVKPASPDLQGLILEKNEAFYQKVIETYARYKEPEQVLGKNSIVARGILSAQEHLVAAYNLFQAVQDANTEFSKEGTYIIDNCVQCVLTENAFYTQGDDFVYLQCWFMFEHGVKAVIPILKECATGYVLQFVSPKTVHLPYKQKEMQLAIKSSYKVGTVMQSKLKAFFAKFTENK